MGKEIVPSIVWNKEALRSFQKIYCCIFEDSYSNAEKVRIGILKIISTIPNQPTKFGLDQYKKTNLGNFRYFEKYSLRIAFKHTETEIRILRIRHVKQEPKSF